jgi:hypothetical protein
MLADDDLPPWLQVLAVNARLPGRAHGGDSPPDSTTGVRDVAPVDDDSLPPAPGIVPDEPVAIPTREEVRDASHAGAEAGNVATDPVAPAFHEVTVRDEAAPPPTRGKSAWWLSDQAVALLMIAMLLTIIYVVLVASGVV